MRRHFKALDLNKEEYKEFILENIEIDPYFPQFCRKVKRQNISFKIISGGFINAIEAILERAGFNSEEFEIYANRLLFEDEGIKVVFHHKLPECSQEYGPCGNCKVDHLKAIAEGKKIVYIGDGLTDRCAGKAADLIFAKGDLKEFLNQRSQDHVFFSNFKEVETRLFGDFVE